MRDRAAIALAALLGCAHAPPRAYREAAALAAREAHAGRLRPAADAWDRAATLADRARERSDAAYRAADAHARAGDRADAIARFDRVGASSPTDPLAARARLEAALLRLEAGETAEAVAALDALTVDAPDGGAARRAMDHRLRLFREAGDDDGALAWLRAREDDPRVRGTDLECAAAHARASLLVERSRHAEAVAVWEALFARRPFGHNTHWDDGHLALARALRTMGAPDRAVAALDALFARWEPASLAGSTTAPRMPEAALLRARILRDDLHDDAAAARAYRFVYERLRDSRVRDDAMWEEAELRERAGDAGACALWVRLVTELPCSPRGRRATDRARACGAAVVDAGVRGCGER